MKITNDEILMYSKAEDIQKLWTPLIGDYIGSISDNHGIEYCGLIVGDKAIKYSYHPFCKSIKEIGILEYYLYDEPEMIKDMFVWLPTQEQLQKIFLDKYAWIYLVDDFYSYAGKCIEEWDLGENPSMNILWLGFIMKEIYNKVWDSKHNEWIKI
jgi:hypothetical protein